ncbi:MAG: hypothetical protein KF734_05900 [Saprospiraceae bacterium]|nr:hypothetical protein [Saprospiraceae bacterium]
MQQESVTMKGISPGELVLTSIVEWRGEWWVTGTIASLGNAEFALKNMNKKFDPSTVSFYAWSEEQQQALRDIAANMEAAYLEYFGAPMAFFKNEKDLHTAFLDANDFYNGKLNMGGAPKPEARNFLTSPSKLYNRSGMNGAVPDDDISLRRLLSAEAPTAAPILKLAHCEDVSQVI